VSDGLRFIDADGHILEPPTAMQDFAPASWRDRIWHLETDAKGKEWAVWNGRRSLANPYAAAGTAGFSDEIRLSAARGELKYSEVRPSAFEPGPFLEDLGTDGIEASVVYPSLMLDLANLPDPVFAAVQARAYNDYISAFVAYDPNRLFAVAVLPQQDIDAAAREIRRVAGLPGIVAVMIRPNPTADGKPFSHIVYDPLWQAATDTGLPIGLHPAPSTGIPNIAEAMGFTHVGMSEAPLDSENLQTHDMDNAFFVGSCVQMDVMATMMFLLGGGVCARFPDLRFIFLEANGGWLVPWLERLDHHAAAYPWDVPLIDQPPSAYFKRQCWISFDPDESTLAFTALSPLCGPDRIIWASDYPHQDSKFPGTTAEVAAAIQTLDDDGQAMIAGGNAAELYRIPIG
jgi:predicted TIM-barrel fold metal-dependent hydrolase